MDELSHPCNNQIGTAFFYFFLILWAKTLHHECYHCQYGMRTFAMAAATLWNSLNVRDRGNRIRGSPSLESFKSNLKTLLFKEHFYPFSS